MKKLLISIIFALVALAAQAQTNNIYTSGGISQTVGAPTYRPGAKGNIVAIDTVTGFWYVSRDRYSVNWYPMGDRVETVAGCAAPGYTPGKFQSGIVFNTCSPPEIYIWTGAAWEQPPSGGGGTVSTDATIDGNGSGGSPLSIAQQSATSSQFLSWTGATWEPSWGTPYTFVTSGAAIATDINTVLIGTVGADITIGLPTCNAANDEKTFEIKKNGSDSFGAVIDPAGSELFYDGASTKTIYSPLSLNCTCRFSGTGVWFYSN